MTKSHPDDHEPRTHLLERSVGSSQIFVGCCGFKSMDGRRFTGDPDEVDCGNCQKLDVFEKAVALKLGKVLGGEEEG